MTLQPGPGSTAGKKNLDILFSKVIPKQLHFIFDEVDALFGKRGSDAGEDKASAVAFAAGQAVQL